ncbi:MAG: hypothetical protein EAZ85_00230 [Bacteroidetes bacterium]|nr:MAG: hypothetical protein EAZ85_00230 [Bacteroidota bacterium]TAG90579.1 MAG: hypothetical protein EAZ20_04135 [Bacteroidota bacterium]
MQKFENIIKTIFGVGISVAILLLLLNFSKIEIGNVMDWAIGFGIFAWLLVITTIPWDIYFEANSVLNHAALSKKKEISFDEKELIYVKKVAFNALWIAVLIHIISAIVLYLIAHFKISVLGYYGSGASVLLTFLRPSVRFYQYISERLSNIGFEAQYPRDDVRELSNKVTILEQSLLELGAFLDEGKEDSWIFRQNKFTEKHEQDIKLLQKKLAYLQELLEQQSERISRETQNAIAEINRDGKFVDKFVENLVEIIRFIKKV